MDLGRAADNVHSLAHLERIDKVSELADAGGRLLTDTALLLMRMELMAACGHFSRSDRSK